MRGYQIKTRFFKLIVKNLQRRKSGLFFFRKGIPKDLRIFYRGRSEIVRSLQVYDERIAAKLANNLSDQYEKEFSQLRQGSSIDVEAERVIRSSGLKPLPMSMQDTIDAQDYYNELMNEIGSTIENIDSDEGVFSTDFNHHELDPVLKRVIEILHDNRKFTLTDAMDRLIKLNQSKPRRVEDIERHFKFFIDTLPSEIISNITKQSVEEALETLHSSGRKTLTVKKYRTTVSKGISDLHSFHGVIAFNPFADVRLVGEGLDQTPHHTFTPAEFNSICNIVRSKPSLESSKLIGMLVNTGCRISEIAGIELSNIILTGAIPHIVLQNQTNRRLKNKSSKRDIPLVGISLEAAKWVMNSAKDGQLYAFPVWNKGNKLHAKNPSAAVSRILKQISPEGSSHSFRHTMNTRLRAANVNHSDINDFHGWFDGSMSKHYGKFDNLQRHKENLEKLRDFESKQEGWYSGI